MHTSYEYLLSECTFSNAFRKDSASLEIQLYPILVVSFISITNLYKNCTQRYKIYFNSYLIKNFITDVKKKVTRL